MRSSVLVLMVLASGLLYRFQKNPYSFCVCSLQDLALAFTSMAEGDSTKNRKAVSRWEQRLLIAIGSRALDLTLLVHDDHDPVDILDDALAITPSTDDGDSQASMDMASALAINLPAQTDQVSIDIIDDGLAIISVD